MTRENRVHLRLPVTHGRSVVNGVESYGAASGTTPRQGCGKVPRGSIEWATYQSERRSLEIEIGTALTWKSPMKRTAFMATCSHV